MKYKMIFALTFAAVAGMLLVICPAYADTITFEGSGINGTTNDTVSASVDFTSSGDGTLQILLTNITSGGTLSRSDLLTNLFFTIGSANPVLSLSSATGTVVQYGHTSIANVNVAATNTHKGGYQFLEYPGGNFPNNSLSQTFPYEYGLSTVGDSGLFSGNLTQNDNYAIVAAGTNLSISGIKSLPLVEPSVAFVLSGFGVLTADDVTGVSFAFGSTPDVQVAGTKVTNDPPPITTDLINLEQFEVTPVPEPGSILLLASGLASAFGALHRKIAA